MLYLLHIQVLTSALAMCQFVPKEVDQIQNEHFKNKMLIRLEISNYHGCKNGPVGIIYIWMSCSHVDIYKRLNKNVLSRTKKNPENYIAYCDCHTSDLARSIKESSPINVACKAGHCIVSEPSGL